MYDDCRFLRAWHVLPLCSVFLLMGCVSGKQQRVERPHDNLFHPRTAVAKNALETSLNVKLAIEGPTVPMVPGDDDYTILITDLTGEVANTRVTFYPSNIATVDTAKSFSSTIVYTVCGEELEGLEEFEVMLVGSAGSALNLTDAIAQGLVLRRSFDVTVARDVETEEIMIEGPPPPIVADTGRTHRIWVADFTGEPEKTRVTVFPGDAATRNDAESKNGMIALDVNAEKLKGLDHFDVLVIGAGAEAEGKSLAEAKNDNMVASKRFEVEQPIGEHSDTFLPTTINLLSYEDTANEFGRNFANTFYAADVQFTNKTNQDLLLYGSSLRTDVRYLMDTDDVKKEFGQAAIDHPELLNSLQDSDGRLINYFDFVESRRPMSFSDVLAVFDYQRRGQAKQRAIDYLKFIGALATGASVFVSGADYAEGVAFFTGIFTPELEKLLLWDILLHIRNLDARSLKEVEEVPKFGQIHRVVYFPRRAIYGVIPQVPVYIAEIVRPEDNGKATADAIAVSKLGTTKEEVLRSSRDFVSKVLADNPKIVTDLMGNYKAALDQIAKIRGTYIVTPDAGDGKSNTGDAPAVAEFPTVKEGDTNDTYADKNLSGIVSIIREELTLYDKNLKTDDSDTFGPELTIAVKTFQEKTGLEQTGQVNKATRERLFHEAAQVYKTRVQDRPKLPPDDPNVDVRGPVRYLQTRLGQFNYTTGTEGEYDKATRDAVTEVQRKHPLLAEDGIVGPETWLVIDMEGSLVVKPAE